MFVHFVWNLTVNLTVVTGDLNELEMSFYLHSSRNVSRVLFSRVLDTDMRRFVCSIGR